MPLPQQGIGISHTQRDRVRYSPDGSRAVTFAVGRGAQLWNTIDWTPLAILAETEPVLDALFSADGRLLATATSQGTARVWDPTTGSPLGPELEHPDRVFRGRFSPDGRHLFTACRDQFARLWDWRTGQLALNPLDHKGEVFDVGFTRDGRALLTCGTYALQSEVRSWSIDDGLPLLEPHLLPATCYSMLPTGDGRFVCGTTSGIEILDYAAAIAAIATAGSTDQLRRECELLSSRRLQADGNLFNLTGEELLELWRER